MTDRERFIVTGGAGFVGSNLVAALLAREPRPDVLVIDTFRSSSFANIVEACERGGVGLFEGRVVARSTTRIRWERLVDRFNPTAVFHLAAITDTTIADEREMVRENVGGFASMMRACHQAGIPLVYASSAATYGTPPQTASRVAFPESAAGKPNNVYGFSKWLMECEHRRFSQGEIESQVTQGPITSALAKAMSSLGQTRTPHIVGLRYFNVFGPGEGRKGKMASMVYQLARQMLAGQAPRLFTDGSQARDQVYVDDVVACTIAASGIPAPGQSPLLSRSPVVPGVYNLGSGVATSFNQIIEALRMAMEIPESKLPTEYFDMPAHIRAFYQDYTCADMAATQASLRWKPKWNPMEAIAAYGRMLRK